MGRSLQATSPGAGASPMVFTACTSQRANFHGPSRRMVRGHLERSLGARSLWQRSWPGDDAALAQHAPSGGYSVAYHRGVPFPFVLARLVIPRAIPSHGQREWCEAILSGAWGHAHSGCVRGLVTMRLWRSTLPASLQKRWSTIQSVVPARRPHLSRKRSHASLKSKSAVRWVGL